MDVVSSVEGDTVDVSTVVIESVLISVLVDKVPVFMNVVEDDSATVLDNIVDGAFVDNEAVMVFIPFDVEPTDEVMSVPCEVDVISIVVVRDVEPDGTSVLDGNIVISIVVEAADIVDKSLVITVPDDVVDKTFVEDGMDDVDTSLVMSVDAPTDMVVDCEVTELESSIVVDTIIDIMSKVEKSVTSVLETDIGAVVETREDESAVEDMVDCIVTVEVLSVIEELESIVDETKAVV